MLSSNFKITYMIIPRIVLHSLACIAGGIFGMQEVKFFGGRAAKSERRSCEKYRMPENLGFLHAAHFYHLIDVNWSELNQPIRTDNFRMKT